MNPLDNEISDALKHLGKQVEAQVPPQLYDVARLVSSAPVKPARTSRWRRLRLGKALEIAAACVLVSSLVGAAAYRNLHSAASQGQSDACGYRATIGDNLRLAAGLLPLPSARISVKTDPQEPKEPSWAERMEPFFRSAQEKGHLGYRISGDEAELSTWGGPTPSEPAVLFDRYRFPRGSLTEQSPLPEIITQLGAAAVSGHVSITHTFTVVPRMTQEEYDRSQILSRSWTLKDVLRWYEADSARPTCVTRSVPGVSDGPVDETQVPMLDLHNGKFVGFRGDKLITYSEGEGMVLGGDQTVWYTVPGLLPTDRPSTTPLAKRPPQSAAEVARARAERTAREAQFEQLKAEVAKAEAEHAATTLPKLEEVGEAAYARAAQADAERGLKMKELQVQLGHLYQEINDPLTPEQKLEKEIEYHRVGLTDSLRSWQQTPGDPQAAKLIPLKQRQLAGLDQIEREFRAGSKTASQLLTELDLLLNPPH